VEQTATEGTKRESVKKRIKQPKEELTVNNCRKRGKGKETQPIPRMKGEKRGGQRKKKRNGHERKGKKGPLPEQNLNAGKRINHKSTVEKRENQARASKGIEEKEKGVRGHGGSNRTRGEKAEVCKTSKVLHEIKTDVPFRKRERKTRRKGVASIRTPWADGGSPDSRNRVNLRNAGEGGETEGPG